MDYLMQEKQKRVAGEHFKTTYQMEFRDYGDIVRRATSQRSSQKSSRQSGTTHRSGRREKGGRGQLGMLLDAEGGDAGGLIGERGGEEQYEVKRSRSTSSLHTGPPPAGLLNVPTIFR